MTSADLRTLTPSGGSAGCQCERPWTVVSLLQGTGAPTRPLRDVLIPDVSTFRRCADSALSSFATFPRPASWGAAFTAFQPRFEAVGVRPVHAILNLPGDAPNIAPHVQEYLWNIHPEWRDTLGQ